LPIYCYEPRKEGAGCDHCRDGFELSQPLSEPALQKCPECGVAIRRAVTPIRVGRSVSGLDDRAKEAGFTKLKRLGKGEYEKVY